MHSRIAVLLVLCASISLGAGVNHVFHFSADKVYLGTDRGYVTVDYAGAAHIDDLGMPDLPALVCHIVIPAGATAVDLEIISLEEEPLREDCDVLPVQHRAAWRADWPAQPFVHPDPAIYSKDALYPEQPAQLGNTGTKSGYRLVDFCVYPVRYNPVRRELTLIRELGVRVNYELGRYPVTRRSELQTAIHGEHVSHLVLNPGDVSRFASPVRRSTAGSCFLPAGQFEHVIITRSVWADSLQRLADWRTRQGWRSRIMLLESICAVYPGRDTAERMRNFVKDADTTWGTLFLFIARDDYPAMQYRLASAAGYTMKSDMYFSDLDGDWDANRNNVFGEVADSVQGYADVFVGMITLNGFAELSNYLNKVFRYELSPDTTANWVQKQLLPNGTTYANQYNDSAANASPTPPWFDCKMYTSGGMVTPTPQKFCDSINSGYGIGCVIAHGSPDLFGLGGNITSPMMLGLTNTNRLNFSTYVCCKTGEWGKGSTNGDCIAENMVFHAPNGFVGICMNDQDGWVDCAELLNYAICYGVYGFRTRRKPTTGEALAYGKDYWMFRIKDSAKYRMELYERNLFGEPAVPLWTEKPFAPQVTFPSAVRPGVSTPVPITVSKSASPVCSALVCLFKKGEVFSRGWTNSSGQVTLSVSPLTPGAIHLSITRANCVPFVDSIYVISSGKHITYLRHFVSDPAPGGNGDSVINPAEAVRIPMQVRNHGTQTARGVTGRLITHTPGVTITDALKDFGDVAGRDSAENTVGFGMQVAGGLPNNYAIPCSLVCRDNTDSTWVSYVTFRIGAPVINVVSREVKDKGGTRPNGRLDPYETVDLEVTIRNSGLGTGSNVRAILRSADSRVTVSDSEAVYGTVRRDSSKTNTTDRFTITAWSIPAGSVVTCTVSLYADGGYASKSTFQLVVGEVWAIDPIADGPRQPPLYWAYDNKDSTCDQRPEYSWVEINNLGTRISYPNHNAVLVVNLPPAFGPFIYYDRRYTQLSISADGWIAPGNYTTSHPDNITLPSTSAPPGAICVNWDNLYPAYASRGYVYYYHDAPNRRFIIEYDSVAYSGQAARRDKFQVVIYDTTLANLDGNNIFLFQYKTALRNTSNTIGLQDPEGNIGILCSFDGTLNPACFELTAERAILFCTEEPTGLTEGRSSFINPSSALSIAPNPFRGTAVISLQLPADGPAQLGIYDRTGRCVRTFPGLNIARGACSVTWDGADAAGRRLARGIYFVRLLTPTGVSQVKTVLSY